MVKRESLSTIKDVVDYIIAGQALKDKLQGILRNVEYDYFIK